MWSEDRIERLKKLWADGHSASRIAAMLGGVSRNSVISKVHRLGLPQRRTATSAHRAAARPTQKRRMPRGRPENIKPMRFGDAATSPVSLPAEPLPPAHETDVARMKLVDLDATPGVRNCRWPVGDPHDESFGFCGQPVASGLSYCEHHCRRAFNHPILVRRPHAATVLIATRPLETTEA